MQALLEVVDSGAKNMEIAIVRFGQANEVLYSTPVRHCWLMCCSAFSCCLNIVRPSLCEVSLFSFVFSRVNFLGVPCVGAFWSAYFFHFLVLWP